MATERLQKILAQAGVASRRAAEALIAEGRVRVNGRIVREQGVQADAHKDRIEVNGKRVVAEKPVYFVVNKPREVVTTLDDPEGRQTIKHLLRHIPERVYPIGRLDYHTSGVLLLTNDGEMAQALLHPRKGVPKTYVVKVRGSLDVPELDQLRNGVDIGEARPTGKAEVFVLREERGNAWLQMTIREGKNRQIHRMLEALGYRVQRLSRVSFAGIDIEGLKPGELRPLGGDELRKLKRDYLNPAKRAKVEAAEAEAMEQMAGPLASAMAAAARGRRGPSAARGGGPARRGGAKKKASKRAPAKKAGAGHASSGAVGGAKRSPSKKKGAPKRTRSATQATRQGAKNTDKRSAAAPKKHTATKRKASKKKRR